MRVEKNTLVCCQIAQIFLQAIALPSTLLAMNVTELEALVELVKDAKISEITLKQGDQRVTIKKPHPRQEYAEGAASEAYSEDDEYAEDMTIDSSLVEPEPVVVIAPVVGYFHHVKPIVGLNASVTAGQTVGIVKAMQLNNEVTASVGGVIVDVLVKDGQPVEYGQPLYRLLPSE